MFKLVVPWFWPWEQAEASPQTLLPEEWNQERIHFENQPEAVESAQDKMLRMAPSFGDLKKLVL